MEWFWRDYFAAMTKKFLVIAPLSCIQRFIVRSRLSSLSFMEVGFVIKKQDNPEDTIVPVITEILHEIIRNLPDHPRALVTGFSVTPGPAVPPMVFRLIGDDDRRRLPFETIESEDFIFITARLPIHLMGTPHVEIMQDALHVFVDERVAIIFLHAPVEVSRSHYTVHHGVLDITLRKLKKPVTR
jgi:hypothetical protein